jgi:hypothetical protein
VELLFINLKLVFVMFNISFSSPIRNYYKRN